MTERKVTHATFTIERSYPHPTAAVFHAWADPQAKAEWFAGPAGEWTPEIRDFDFRVGGRERVRGRFSSGKVSDFRALYHEIVPNARIVYVYDMYVNDRQLSVSLATIQFQAEGQGTRMTFTEQGAFLDDFAGDAPGREQGTIFLVEKFGAALARRAANA